MYNKFLANIYFLTEYEGGRKTNIPKSLRTYRPLLYYKKNNYHCQIDLENIPIHMVGINGVPSQDGIFNVNDIVPLSSGDKKRLIVSNQRNAYSLKNFLEIRVIEIKNRYSSLRE